MSEDAPLDWPSTKWAPSPRSAGDEKFLLYTRQLIGLAREQLHGSALHRADPEDSIQPVMTRVYARAGEVRLDVDEPENLWALIARLTRRKCGQVIGRTHTQARDSSREGRAQNGGGGDSEGSLDLADYEPTPRDLAVFDETLALLFRKMQPHERPILERKLHGDSVTDIAEALQFNERKVYRVLDRVKQLLLAM